MDNCRILVLDKGTSLFGEFISEIVLKFRCSFELWLALKLKRKKDVIDYNMLDGVELHPPFFRDVSRR